MGHHVIKRTLLQQSPEPLSWFWVKSCNSLYRIFLEYAYFALGLEFRAVELCKIIL